METITVQSYIGEKEVNKDEYVARWVEQVADLWCITETPEEKQKAYQIKEDIKALAGANFDRLLEEQSN